MADYHSLLAKAVDTLDPNTAGARQRIYDRARSTMRSTVQSTVLHICVVDVATAKIAMEAAITKVESLGGSLGGRRTRPSVQCDRGGTRRDRAER